MAPVYCTLSGARHETLQESARHESGTERESASGVTSIATGGRVRVIAVLCRRKVWRR